MLLRSITVISTPSSGSDVGGAVIRQLARSIAVFITLLLPLGIVACDTVPDEAVTLADTVGRDLEEVHRAHRELANLLYGRVEAEINHFIDDTYRPAYIALFAENFDLPDAIQQAMRDDPDDLLDLLTDFVSQATVDIEAKRRELLEPIQAENTMVIEEIDAAHRQIQQGHDVVVSHLRSVRAVRDTQNELLSEVGLGDLRQRIATRTAEVSSRVGDLVVRARGAETQIDSAAERIGELDEMIDELKAGLGLN